MTLEIEYRIAAQQDDTPVRGNAMASGDSAEDKKVEDEILARLDRGDEWAWALVDVSARVTVDGKEFAGRAYLGACCYENEAAFKADGYYEDMCKEAVEDLIKELRQHVAKGVLAQVALGHLEAARLL